MIKKFFSALIIGTAACGAGLLAMAAPVYENGSDRPLANFTSTTINVPAADTATVLTAPSRNIEIQLSSGSAITYVRFDNGVATSANYAIPAGGKLSLKGLPFITKVDSIGASALGTESILAW